MSTTFRYFSNGKLQTLRLKSAGAMRAGPAPDRRVVRAGVREPRRVMRGADARRAFASTAPQALHHIGSRLANRFRVVSEAHVRLHVEPSGTTAIVPTETVILVGAKASVVKYAREKFGFEVIQEGSFGKVLLRAPDDVKDGIEKAFEVANALYRRDRPVAAHPNFLRFLRRLDPGPANPSAGQWNLDNDGTPGVVGADVAALAAWTITRGDRDVRVAVLDEGVDTKHAFLSPAVVAERDFVDGNNHARPSADDAHGTACAGIIVSQDQNLRGLAPGVSLVAARIAKSDAYGNWVFDDFDTADAIDWCWNDAGAHVLSNSWGGGPPADAITQAFLRAQTRGRGGKGCVIAIAAGNAQAPVDYPATLPGVLGVGASNEWDKRKTRTSEDGEDWWGSNYGRGLDMLAPGVHIRTTDIRGASGYDDGDTTATFNGTSSATPHVAAAAALVLSVNPALTEVKVRGVLTGTADKLRTGGWNPYEGHGRLNVFAALRRARRL